MNEDIRRGDFFKNLIPKSDKKNENSGEKAKNKFFSPEEWFEKYYQGENNEELPKNIFKDVDPETIEELKSKYSFRNPQKKNLEVKQIDLFE